MSYKLYSEMTEAERAEIDRQEDKKEAWKQALAGWDPPSEEDFGAPEGQDLSPLRWQPFAVLAR